MEDDYFNNILDKYKDDFYSIVAQEYLKGSLGVTQKVGVNALYPDKKEVKILTDQMYDLIKGVTKDMSQQIRREIRESTLQRESREDLRKRLDNIFKGDNPTRFRYEKRLELIRRTEKTRILNTGAFNTARKLGATKKYIDIVKDNRTTDISKAMYAKYGSKEKAISMDEEFQVMVNGKEYKGLYPPFMPNDRDMILFLFEKE